MIFPIERLRLIKDIERCPFVAGQKGYSEWIKADDERLLEIESTRMQHIEALEADGFFILSHSEMEELAYELAHSHIQHDRTCAIRAVRRMLNLITMEPRK